MRWCWLAMFCAIATAAAGEYAGPAACARCHPAQSHTQVASRHARALRPIRETPLPELLASQKLGERSGVTFEYVLGPQGVVVNTVLGKRKSTALLEWTFGAGAQAFTPVGRTRGRFFEHRISWYAAAQGARRTLGHPGVPSPDPEKALGIVQDADTIYRCFNCHATGVKTGPDLTGIIPGVTCERCHGRATEHVVERQPMASLRNNRKLVMGLCGSCHRLPDAATSATPEKADPLSIRFAPVGLMASGCYKKSQTLSCITCHDPHQDASSKPPDYDAKCLSCHRQLDCKAGGREGCVSCHMPRSSAVPYLTFTDHRIR